MIVLALEKKVVALTGLKHITAVILCGGHGRRFGGAEKPLARLSLAGKTQAMVDHVIDALPREVPRLISANNFAEEYDQRGQVVADRCLGEHVEGPLLGIYSAMLAAARPWLLVCPGDMPLLPLNWHAPLIDSVDDSLSVSLSASSRPRVIHDGERLQPLLCLVPVSLASSLKDYLEQGGKSVQQWHRSVFSHPVEFSGSTGALVNINTRQALARLNAPLL